jgi:cell division protein FtsI (penicillin-binding protein 3)
MKRIRILNLFLFFISLVYFSYLFYIQCIKHKHFDDKAKNQHEKKFELFGSRGNIYDRNGLPLATSQECFSIFCSPQYIDRKEHVIKELSSLSGRSQSEIRKQVNTAKFFWVERKVDVHKRDKYVEIADPSVGYTHDLNRQYNMREIFEPLIGKCGSDNSGIEGLELQLNSVLSGESGFVMYQKDPTGEIFPYHNYPEKDPKPGNDVYLTIDLNLQSILYAKLKECLVDENARHASGVIVDPKTGEILALANVGKQNDKRNHAVCDEFEPGSTFKLITLTYALLDGYKEDDVIDTEGGKYKIHGHTIHDYRNYGTVTFEQAIAHSSNVAMVKISKTFDRQDYFLLMRDFGLGQVTGIELPGEVRGKIPSSENINDVEFATLVFGQGLTVNLLQLAFMYQVIANDGVLVKPSIVYEIRERGKTLYQANTLRIRRVIDAETADRVTSVLCSVVQEGSGTEAAIDGLSIAGKTGTAQKAVNGAYSNTSITTTFVGFFPSDSPDYLIAIMFDEPKQGMWASTIAAPVFRNIAQSIYQMNTHHYAAK